MGALGALSETEISSIRELPLRRNWNSAVAYDTIGESTSAATTTFVGREQLLDELVDSIADPGQRGTYLVSGYRGAGKTTLIIEAARRARAKLQETHRNLLPVVLNVSEVSASLVDPSAKGPTLPISPQRLLVALLRRLAQCDVDKEIAAKAKESVDQVTAATYESRRGRSNSSSAERVTETTITFSVADVWKVLAAVAAIVAMGLFGFSVWGSARSLSLGAAVGLSGVAVASFVTSRTSRRSQTSAETAETSITIDNSMQRMELDVQDILARLHTDKLRTIVIIEELDKLDDPDGNQLASLISYFKNLFTQAPALFFFVTDKAYYDLVASRMERARASRTYAVEHTFFTHRLFVSRPSIANAYQFLRDAIDDEAACVDLRAIEEADGDRVRNVNDMDCFEQFVRFTLLRSEGHLFDLKKELERHRRASSTPNAGTTVLFVGEESLSPRERAMATLQFLVESKARAFSFGESRGYATETLRSYLYNVARTIGSDVELSQAAFLPGPSEVGYDLSNGEIASIKDAVISLINDLTAGGALARSERPDGAPAFRWVPRAEFVLRLRGVLEAHEELLATDLIKAADLSRLLGEGGSLTSLLGNPQAIDMQTQAWRNEAETLRQSPRPAMQEVTDTRRGRLRDEVSSVVSAALLAHVDRLRERGWGLTPARTDQRVWEVLLGAPGGRLLLTYGLEASELQATLDVGSPPDFASVAIVSVTLDASSPPVNPSPLATRGGQSVTLNVSLAESQGAGGPDADWGVDASTELFAAQQWLSTRVPLPFEQPRGTREHEVLFVQEGTSVADVAAVGLDDAVDAWLHGTDRLLGVLEGASPVGLAPFSIELSRALARPDPSFKVAVDPNGFIDNRAVEIERLAASKRLVITEYSMRPAVAASSWSDGAKVVRDLRSITPEDANTGGLAFMVPNNTGSVTQAGMELERLRPSLGRELLQRSARQGDHQAIRRLLQIGVWSPEDLDARNLAEPPSILLFDAAADPGLTDSSIRTKLLVAAYQRGATHAIDSLRQMIDASPPDADDRAEIAAAAFALARATTLDEARTQWLRAAAARDHVPALVELLRESLDVSNGPLYDQAVAGRLAHLGQAATVAGLVDPIDHDGALAYLDLGVRRDEPAAMRALAAQVQGENPERARELRALADQRQAPLPSVDPVPSMTTLRT